MENVDVDKGTIEKNITAMRSGLSTAIAERLKQVVEAATDQALAQQIARDTLLAAILATEPVFELLQLLSLTLLNFTVKLNEAARMIILLNASSGASKPN